jgi:hypothetical protein
VDGAGITAEFNDPTALAVDNAGNVYAVDSGNNALRRISSTGVTTTLLSSTSFSFADVAEQFFGQTTYSIKGVAVDSLGNPYLGVSVSIPSGLHSQEYSYVLKVSDSGAYFTLFDAASVYSDFGYAPGDGALCISGSTSFYVLAGNDIYLDGTGISDSTPSLSFPLEPLAIAVDQNGRIFEANDVNGIVVVTPVGTAPEISSQPVGTTLAFGAGTLLSVTATGAPAPTYQWQVDGTDIAGATSPTYLASMPGTYDVLITNAAGTVTSSPVVITAATRLLNISSRASVGTGANIEIAGFVITGPPGTSEQLLIRAAGPSLSQFGVSGALAQPILTLYNSSGTQIASNTGWNTASNASAIAAAFATTGAFAFQLDSADSAILTTLPPGTYTAQISGVGGTTGVALAEVYEVVSGDPELINISTRAYVGTGSGAAIGGFVVSGTQSAKVLIRAIGPSLSQFGVGGVLAQPSLNVVDSSGNTVATNTGWSTNANAAIISQEMQDVGAFPLPSGSADCVLLLTLAPGAYTAVVSGVGGTSGVALVEVYEAP